MTKDQVWLLKEIKEIEKDDGKMRSPLWEPVRWLKFQTEGNLLKNDKWTNETTNEKLDLPLFYNCFCDD